MARKVRFVDNLPVSAYGSSGTSDTATSASFATTALSASYATTASHALFAVSASHEIVKEVSSSHANTADVANGLQGQPSIYVTNVTASGDISSSGTIITENGNVKNNLTVGGDLDIADTIYHTGDSNTKIRFPENDTIAFNTSGDERFRISPDGNISSSNSLTINNITSSGDILLNEDQRIYFEADKNTYIESHASDSFRAVVNNRQMFLLDEDTGNRAVFGNGTKVFIGADNNHLPSNQLEVSGSVSVLGGGTAGGHITASGNVSSSATSTASFGTYLGDGSQLSGISTTPFPFTGEAQITGSLIISGSNSYQAFTGFDPMSKLTIGGNVGNTFNFVHTPAIDTGIEVLPQLLAISGSRDGAINATIHIGSAVSSAPGIGDNVVVPYALYVSGRFNHPNNIGTGGGDEGYVFSVTGSSGNATGGIISLGKKGTSLSGTAIHLNGHLTASAGANISASITSTASFGTYLGDGSQLSNISTTPFPFTGDAQITGSLIVSGSGNITSSGYMLITSSNTGGSGAAAMTPGLVINQLGSSQNYSGPAIRLVNATNGEESNIYHQPGGSGAANGNALNIITDGGINIEAGDDIGSGGAFFRLQKGQALFTIDDDWSAPRTDVKIHNGNGGTAYSRLSLGASSEYWYIEADDNNTPFNIGFDNGSTDTDVITFTKHNGSLTGSFAIIGGPLRVTGSAIISSSNSDIALTVQGSGSTVFNIIGSEGTLFAIEDDLDGTLFTVNDRSGIPMFEVSASGRIVAEEGESIIRSQRPMVTHTSDFSITSSLDFAGKYHIVGGSITCSINTGSLVPTGAEFEFFQTSSAGNFLFITGSPHVDVIVKNDNMNLAGQGSGASLKYIGGSTFHLVGDLT